MQELTIYFPMTCNVLTKGHIRCLEILSKKGLVIVGLLTSKALEGYKEELMPFEERKYILEIVAMGIGNIIVVPQNSLDPIEKLQAFKCNAIASGDGFEKIERQAAKKLNLKKIRVNSRCPLHSSDIWNQKNKL